MTNYGIFRGPNINLGDAMTFARVPGAVMLGTVPVESVAAYMPARRILRWNEMLEYDVLDTPELYWSETEWALTYHPAPIVTVFEQLPSHQKRLRPELLECAKAFVARSWHAAQSLVSFADVPAEKVHVIHPGVDCDKFTCAPTQSAPFTIGFVGKLFWRKGVWDLLWACKTLDFPYRLVMIGEGDQDVRLDDEAKRLGVPLEMAGGIAHADMPAWYNRFDVLVLPSLPTDHWVEQFGLCMLEALACGVPVIATAQTGAIEIQNKQLYGVTLVPCAHYQLLAEALRMARDTETNRLALAKRTRECWDSTVKAQEYEEVLR